MRPLISFVVVAVLTLPAINTLAANSVSVESRTVAAGATDVPIGIYLVNDTALCAIVVPLEIRSVTPGASIIAMKMSFGGRLTNTLNEVRVTTQFGTKSLACKGSIPGYGDFLYFTENEKHPVTGLPEGALFVRARMQILPLLPGADVTPSMILTVDVGPTPGTIEIDTTCTVQSNHLAIMVEPPFPSLTDFTPDFTKGVITIVACDCAHHGDLNGDDVIDVFDSSLLIDYVFGGYPIPPTDPGCPHIDRGDVNCDGGDDIFDVIYMNEYLYSSGPEPCNPCSCSPYPTNCP